MLVNAEGLPSDGLGQRGLTGVLATHRTSLSPSSCLFQGILDLLLGLQKKMVVDMV